MSVPARNATATDGELEWHAVHARRTDSAVVRKLGRRQCVQPLSAQSLRSGRRGVGADEVRGRVARADN